MGGILGMSRDAVILLDTCVPLLKSQKENPMAKQENPMAKHLKLYLKPEDLAIRWDMNPDTLKRWRARGYGPRFKKMGRLVRYSIENIESFERSTA